MPLAAAAAEAEGVSLPGHSLLSGSHPHGSPGAGRARAAVVADRLRATLDALAAAGLPPEIVSGGSTPTLWDSHLMDGLTEIRSGSCIYFDREALEVGVAGRDDLAYTVLATVVSTAVPGHAVVDAGSKALAKEGQGRRPASASSWTTPTSWSRSLSEEHGVLDLGGHRVAAEHRRARAHRPEPRLRLRQPPGRAAGSRRRGAPHDHPRSERKGSMDRLSPERIAAVLAGVRSVRVLVVGDLMLDRYISGAVDRISPEAPVPVVRVERESSAVGGAANVAANVAALGAECRVVGCMGRDAAGEQLRGELETLSVRTDGLVATDERPTTVKTRILARRQQVVRFDHESEADAGGGLASALAAAVTELGAASDVLVLEDYNKGVLVPQVTAAAEAVRARAGSPRWWTRSGGTSSRTAEPPSSSPTRRSWRTPWGSSSTPTTPTGWRRTRIRLGCENLLLTLGEHGMALQTERGRPGADSHRRARASTTCPEPATRSSRRGGGPRRRRVRTRKPRSLPTTRQPSKSASPASPRCPPTRSSSTPARSTTALESDHVVPPRPDVPDDPSTPRRSPS